MPDSPARIRAFRYVDVPETALYRAIMRCFVESRERFTLHLRPAEVGSMLAVTSDSPAPDAPGVDAALQQLCEWGNLERHPDTADVSTVEEFYRPRFLYQMTPAGEAAERAVTGFEEEIVRPGELQTAALDDIRALLRDLVEIAGAEPLDEAHAHRTLVGLRARFDELTIRAQAFMASLQRGIGMYGAAVGEFLSYKDTLINYLERFIGELRLATSDIASLIEQVEARDPERLLRAVAERDRADVVQRTGADVDEAERRWRLRWGGLRAWFLGEPGSPSQAELLRSRARSAIPALLTAVGAINDRRFTRSDRVADLRTLARWFAETPSDAEAHRLWRAAFALAPPRHLRIDHSTVDAREGDAPVPAGASWLGAPSIFIAPRLREIGRHSPPGRPPGVIDRSAEKALLRAEADALNRQIAEAQRRLATGRRTRLGELRLDTVPEMELFLELLGEALTSRVLPGDVAEIASSDGTLRITLEPVGDGSDAVVSTPDGELRGPDHWITIEDVFAQPRGHEQATATASAT